MPAIPLSKRARKNIKGVIVVNSEVIGKCPKPNKRAATIIDTQTIELFSIILPFGFIALASSQTINVMKNNLITTSSAMPP
jgi:hypothetical protein